VTEKLLDVQFSPAAAADLRWLEEKCRTRFGGLEDLGDEIPGERYCATVYRLVEKAIPSSTKTEEKLLRKWFFGPSPDAALGKARAWVEAQFARKRAAA